MRTWLFVPADDEAKVIKAIASSADVVILDLEDGVGDSPARKKLARDVVARVLKAPSESRNRCYVRINALSTGFVDQDIAAAVHSQAAGVVLPKCEGPQDVMKLAQMLDEAEERADIKPSRKASIVAIVTESARGVQLLPEFRSELPRLVALMWGGEDLCADLGGRTNRAADGRYLPPYAAARDACLFAARAAGVLAIDAVYTRYQDTDGLERECKEHGDLGFDAKAAIHPAQLPSIDQALRPTADQIAWAKRVVQSFDDGLGAVAMEGAMIDAPHLLRARNILRGAPRSER